MSQQFELSPPLLDASLFSPSRLDINNHLPDNVTESCHGIQYLLPFPFLDCRNANIFHLEIFGKSSFLKGEHYFMKSALDLNE